jgi:hypothetical protein
VEEVEEHETAPAPSTAVAMDQRAMELPRVTAGAKRRLNGFVMYVSALPAEEDARNLERFQNK